MLPVGVRLEAVERDPERLPRGDDAYTFLRKK